MKRLMWKIALAILTLFLLAGTFAGCVKVASEPSEGLEYASFGNGTCALVGIGTCTDTNVMIPVKSPDGDTVVVVAEDAFAECTQLKSVTFEEGSQVQFIEYEAFDNNKLKKVVFPDSLIYIAERAFASVKLSSCTKYKGGKYWGSASNPYMVCLWVGKELHPDTKFIVNVEEDVTLSFSSKSELIIPEGVVGIEMRALDYENNDWPKVSFPSSLTYMFFDPHSKTPSSHYTSYKDALYLGNEENPYVIFVKATNSEAEEYTINPKTRIIAQEAFSDCVNLKSLSVPDSVVNLDIDIPYSSKVDKFELLHMGQSVMYIDQLPLMSITSTITIPASVKRIGRHASADLGTIASSRSSYLVRSEIQQMIDDGIIAIRFENQDGWYALGTNHSPLSRGKQTEASEKCISVQKMDSKTATNGFKWDDYPFYIWYNAGLSAQETSNP